MMRACGPTSRDLARDVGDFLAIAVCGDAAHAEGQREQGLCRRKITQRHADGIAQVLPDLFPRVVVTVRRPG